MTNFFFSFDTSKERSFKYNSTHLWIVFDEFLSERQFIIFRRLRNDINSEEEERDISAKRRKKTNEGVARSRG